MAEKDFQSIPLILEVLSLDMLTSLERTLKRRAQKIYTPVCGEMVIRRMKKQFQASCLIQMGVSIPLGKEFWCFYIQVVVFKSVVSNR